MSNKRLFSVLMAFASAITIALTVQEGFATTDIVSQENSTKGTKLMECAGLPKLILGLLGILGILGLLIR